MINVIISCYVFLFGLLLGSFFNVCIYRIPKDESIAFPPSHCTSCNTHLKPIDLLPVFSYIFLKGKCRYCKKKISPRYAIIELLTGIIFLGIYLSYGLTFITIKYCVLASFLIVIGMIDYDTSDIYLKTTLSGIITGVIFALAGYFMGYGLLKYFLGAFLGGGIITIIILITHGMGWGDAEICLLSGIFLGFKLTIVTLFFSFVLGGIIGILLIISKKKSKKDYMPFGPYIALGATVAMLYGDKIIYWYLGKMF